MPASTQVPLEWMIRSWIPDQLKSNPVVRTELFNQTLASTPVTNFFAHSVHVSLLPPDSELMMMMMMASDDNDDDNHEEEEQDKQCLPWRRVLRIGDQKQEEEEKERQENTPKSMEIWASRLSFLSIGLCVLKLLIQ